MVKDKKSSDELELRWAYAKGWRGRGNLQSLLDELNRQKEQKFDFVSDGRDMRVVHESGEAGLRLQPLTAQVAEWLPRDGLPVQHRALKQLAGKLLLVA